jgi:hypothetical protein
MQWYPNEQRMSGLADARLGGDALSSSARPACFIEAEDVSQSKAARLLVYAVNFGRLSHALGTTSKRLQ